MKKVLITICASLVLMCVNDPDNNKTTCTPLSDPAKAIEILNPKHGDAFTLGDNVDINFKVNMRMVASVFVEVNANNGNGFKGIFGHSITKDLSGDSIACFDTVWNIGNEYFDIAYTGTDTVTLRIRNYDDRTIYDSVPGIIIKAQGSK